MKINIGTPSVPVWVPVGPTGAVVVTSSTRPSSPTAGLSILETDTDKYYIWDGSAWIFIGGGTGIMHSCQLSKTVNQSITTGTDTVVTWQTEDSDVGGLGNVANNRMVIVQDGLYAVSAALQWNGAIAVGKSASMQICHNGNVIASSGIEGPGGSNNRLNQNYAEKTLRLATGDLMTVEVFINDATGTLIDPTTPKLPNNAGTYFEIIQITM